MAYSSTNPPALISQRLMGGGMAEWVYSSSHVSTVVAADGFFTNAYDLGMRAGDLVTVRNSTAFTVTKHTVLSISTGSTTCVIGDPTTIGSTSNTA